MHEGPLQYEGTPCAVKLILPSFLAQFLPILILCAREWPVNEAFQMFISVVCLWFEN